MRFRSVILLLAIVANMAGCGGDDTVSKGDAASKKDVLNDKQRAAVAELQGVIDDYVREVVEEAKGVRAIYTDGAFDDDIRHEAKRRGVELEPVSVMASPHALRVAVKEGEDVALQLGFELWKRDGKELPICSGVLARPLGMPEEDRLRGVDVARQIGERIITLYEKGVVDFVDDKRTRERLLFVQWRIARIARMRAEREKRAGRQELAQKDVELSDRLDGYNAALKRILDNMEKAKERALQDMTPRERLQLALARADFKLARRFAEPILESDPDDPDANFAMGMYFYEQKQWTRAEEHLRRSLVKKPRQPAIWNNLGMVYMHLGRHDEALKCAKRALEIIPESAEVKDTIKQIEEARDRAKERKR